MPFRHLRLAFAAALGACALLAPPASASFPGANGVLAFPAGAASIRNQDPVDLFASDGPDVLVRLAGGAGYQGAPAYAPDVGPLPARSHGWVTFGCFNNLAKMTPATMTTWAAVLPYCSTADPPPGENSTVGGASHTETSSTSPGRTI